VDLGWRHSFSVLGLDEIGTNSQFKALAKAKHTNLNGHYEQKPTDLSGLWGEYFEHG